MSGAGDARDVVTRLVEVLNAGRLEGLDAVCVPGLAVSMREHVAPFLASFPDMRMEVVELVAEGTRVVGRFRCSGTHLGAWRGHPPSGRRFERVDEVGFFRCWAGASRAPGCWRTRSSECASSASRPAERERAAPGGRGGVASGG